MSIHELEAKARELRQIMALIDEAQAEAVQAGEYKITWKVVKSARIDTAALKKALPDVAQAFTRESCTRRFSIA